MASTPGVSAFTRVIIADAIGIQIGNSPISTEAGQILDADVYFNPSDSQVTFATPNALATNPKSYDLESGRSYSVYDGSRMAPLAELYGAGASTSFTARTLSAP